MLLKSARKPALGTLSLRRASDIWATQPGLAGMKADWTYVAGGIGSEGLKLGRGHRGNSTRM
jgi:hypothetical protein